MSDYCDVLRTQGSDATLDVEIYRPSLELVLDGQINGDPIELPLIAQTVIGGSGGTSTDTDINTADAPYSYTTVEDDQGLISVSIPPSRMSSEGRCGRKSFPAKKQRKTKSSMTRSRSKPCG